MPSWPSSDNKFDLLEEDTEEEEEGATGQITTTEAGNAMGQNTNSKYLIIARVILNQNDNQINIGGTIATTLQIRRLQM